MKATSNEGKTVNSTVLFEKRKKNVELYSSAKKTTDYYMKLPKGNETMQ